MNNKLLRFPSAESELCPNCDAKTAQKKIRSQQFEYGVGDERVILSAQVPVWTCTECSYSFTDEDAEVIRHETVCHHLNLMTPREIVQMRGALGITQKELAELTKLGDASIKRWESGSLLQSSSANMLLRLCENYLSRMIMQKIASERGSDTNEPRFRTTISESQRIVALNFRLRRTG
jgi:putative zinc finger/helix-turn-helix YgiT family protein